MMKHYTFRCADGAEFEADYGYKPDENAWMLALARGTVVELYEEGVLIDTYEVEEV